MTEKFCEYCQECEPLYETETESKSEYESNSDHDSEWKNIQVCIMVQSYCVKERKQTECIEPWI